MKKLIIALFLIGSFLIVPVSHAQVLDPQVQLQIDRINQLIAVIRQLIELIQSQNLQDVGGIVIPESIIAPTSTESVQQIATSTATSTGPIRSEYCTQEDKDWAASVYGTNLNSVLLCEYVKQRDANK